MFHRIIVINFTYVSILSALWGLLRVRQTIVVVPTSCKTYIVDCSVAQEKIMTGKKMK